MRTNIQALHTINIIFRWLAKVWNPKITVKNFLDNLYFKNVNKSSC